MKTWVAAVSWFMPHHCKAWFGGPSQVWATVTFPAVVFIPACNIQSRVVYTKATIDFGPTTAQDSVYVVIPID